MSGRLAVAAVSVALVGLPASAGAAPGDLDPTFGPGGIVRTSAGLGEGNGAGALAIQPDGKILLAGGAFDGFRVARYGPDGQLDASFGSGGIATGPAAAP